MAWWVCGVFSLWIFRLAGRYSLSIGGVAAEPRGGPAISFLWNDGGAGRGVGEVWRQRRQRLATDGVVALRRAFSLAFSGWRSRYYLSMAGGSRARRAGDFFLME